MNVMKSEYPRKFCKAKLECLYRMILRNLVTFVIRKIIEIGIIIFQRSQKQVKMDALEPTRDIRRSAEAEVPVSIEHDPSLHEAGGHLLRLHEEALSGPLRRAVPRLRAQQEIRTSELLERCFFKSR